MVKQARAVREERRALMDARHKYLLTRLVDGAGLGEAEVEEALVSDDKVWTTGHSTTSTTFT